MILSHSNFGINVYRLTCPECETEFESSEAEWPSIDRFAEPQVDLMCSTCEANFSEVIPKEE